MMLALSRLALALAACAVGTSSLSVSSAGRALRSPSPFTASRRLALGVRGGSVEVLSPAPPPGVMSIPASTVAMAKNIMGGGMLALSAGMAAGKGTGWVPAFAVSVGSCLGSAYTFHLLGKAIEKTKAQDFRQLWGATLGEDSAWVIDTILMSLCFGTCIMYACFLGDLLSAMVPAFSRSQAIVAVSVAPLLPLCLMRDLSALSFSSVVGVAAVLYITGFSALRWLDGSCALGGRFFANLPLPPRPEQASLLRVSLGSAVLFNMLNTAYAAHTNAVRFYNELAGRSAARFAAVLRRAFALSAAVYAVVMTAGYATFGGAAQGNLLANYAVGPDALATAGRAATAASILGSHPLLFTSLRDAVISMLRPTLPSLRTDERQWVALTVALLAATSGLAILTPDVGLVVSLAGSLLGAVIIYAVPGLINLALLRGAPPPAGRSTASLARERAASRGLVAFGFAMAVLGTVITCLDSFTDALK